MLFKSNKILPSTLILLLSCFNICTLNASDDGLAQQKSTIAGYTKKLSTNRKIGSTIQSLMDEPSLLKTATSLNSTQVKDQSKVQVYVKVVNTSASQLTELENLGLEIEISNLKLKKIQGWINTNNINRLAELDNVIKISKPSYGHKRVGSRTTEGDAILQSNLVRAQGFTGQGVRVGVISDGSAGLATAQASGDLPSNVVQFSSCIIGNISINCAEGTAMAEIIHDIAPDAELAIADALTTTLEFIQRLDQLANTFNADIIVDDLGFFAEPYFEDGDIAQAVNELPDNVVYISAAGNSANTHYQATYQAISNESSFHDFSAGTDLASTNNISFTIPAGQTVCAVLQWSDPFENAVSDYDLLLVDADLNFIVDEDGFAPGATFGSIAIESACASNETSAEIVNFVTVDLFEGEASEIEIFFNNTNIDITPFIASGSVFGHPAAERAIAVGTINIQDLLQDEIADFSSQGPSRIDFPTRQDRQKPEITGVDGVSVTGSGGFVQTFFGTSAAAPHIAGIAALLKSARPTATRNEIEEALLNGAVDLGTSGTDNTFGTGRANAEDSLELILNGNFDILDFLPAILEAATNKD